MPVTHLNISEPEKNSGAAPWGWHLVLNLYECNLHLITSAEVIRKFVIELCDLINMCRFGGPLIVNFGENPRVAGYSLVQLIETSNICAHFVNDSAAVYLDVFSCKKFNPRWLPTLSPPPLKPKKVKEYS